ASSPRRACEGTGQDGPEKKAEAEHEVDSDSSTLERERAPRRERHRSDAPARTRAMSVTFSIEERVSMDLEDSWINLANQNAADLLAWLGLPADELFGQIPARELAALCRRRLWPEARNADPEVPDVDRGRFYRFGRRAGYLRQRTMGLLHLAELADDGVISWG